MPTDADLKLAEDLADFRLETERRFGSVERTLGDLRADVKEFRAGIESELRWIKRIGGVLVGLVLAVALGSGRVIWDAATVASDVRQHGRRLDQLEGRLDRVEKRLDGIDAKLDVLIRRGEPAATKAG